MRSFGRSLDDGSSGRDRHSTAKRSLFDGPFSTAVFDGPSPLQGPLRRPLWEVPSRTTSKGPLESAFSDGPSTRSLETAVFETGEGCPQKGNGGLLRPCFQALFECQGPRALQGTVLPGPPSDFCEEPSKRPQRRLWARGRARDLCEAPCKGPCEGSLRGRGALRGPAFLSLVRPLLSNR